MLITIRHREGGGMTCDGSGELRYGYLCRGCDNCLGLTTPQPRPEPIDLGPWPRTSSPVTLGPCPWCLSTPCRCAQRKAAS